MIHPASVRTTALLLALSTPAFAQWLQSLPATSPTARTGAAMNWDGTTGNVLLFGGSAPLVNAETWSYDGTNWTLLAPAVSPTARRNSQLVYDFARTVCVLYGGITSNLSIGGVNNQTWEWNGTTWTLMTPTAHAGARHSHGLAFDHVRNVTVMFGGMTSQNLGTQVGTTWEYNGTTWTQITTAGSPGPRERPAMCFHSGIGKTVVFGGFDGVNMHNSTWTYDGTTWTQVPAIGSIPTARNAACLSYDTVRNVCVLSGGQDLAGNVLNDTWTFDGTTWTQQPYSGPTRRDHSQAFLQSTKEIVSFGGFVSAPNTISNETWEFGNGVYGVGCAGTNGVPALRELAAPQLGLPWTVEVTNLNPTFNLGIVAFGFTQLPGVDLTFILGMPGCSAFTTADILLTATATGPGTAQWNWPAVSGLVGDALYAQALCLDPAVNAFGFTISNAIYITLGS